MTDGLEHAIGNLREEIADLPGGPDMTEITEAVKDVATSQSAIADAIGRMGLDFPAPLAEREITGGLKVTLDVEYNTAMATAISDHLRIESDKAEALGDLAQAMNRIATVMEKRWEEKGY